MNNVALVVAMRTGSSRFPNKMGVSIANGKCSIDFFNDLFRALEDKRGKARGVHPVIAMPDIEDENFENEFRKRDISFFKGDENDLLARTVGAADFVGCDYILDITGDCPFVSKYLVRDILHRCARLICGGVDFYCSNVFPERSVPDGQDIQLYSTRLARHVLNSENYNPEHSGYNVWNYFKDTPAIIKYDVVKVNGKANCSSLRMTLDTPEDLVTLHKIWPLFDLFCGLDTQDDYIEFLQCLTRADMDWWPNKCVHPKNIGQK